MKNTLSLQFSAVVVVMGAFFFVSHAALSASATSGTMEVCSYDKYDTSCFKTDSSSVSIPESAQYSVSGSVRRGATGECQGSENFDLFIDGSYFASSGDPDSCEAQGTYTSESFGTIQLSAGSHIIRMVHASQGASTAESVSVRLTFDSIPEQPQPQCGDGTLDAGEQCDDGNTTNGDGCSAQCTIEQDEPQCGDGTLDAGEQCDDGNTTNGDGCSAQCKEEEEEEEEKECKGSIGNTVWLDQNGNGKEDAGEKGLSGVKVWLYHGNSVKKKTTDANGQYTFKKLCKGSYDVVVKNESVSGYTQTYDPDSKKDNKTDVKLTNDNDDHTKADFGYRGKVAPSTGSGSALIMIALALSALISFGAYTVLKKRIAILA